MSQATSLYVDGDSLLHRLDPRAKLALSFALFVPAYVFGRPSFIVLPLAVALAGLLYGGGLRNLRRIWFIIVALFVVGLIVWPGFVERGGPVLVDLGPIFLTEDQFLFAMGRSLRIATFVITGLAYVSTTANEELVRGMRGLGLPYAFCFAVGTALRLFPTFLGAAGTVRQAQEARGLDLSSNNPIQRLRNFVPLLIPVFMTAFRNVETQSMALEARGFDTRRERTFYRDSAFGAGDWGAVVLALVVAGAAIALSTTGVGTF
ncbi:MAG: energy-coupling factor transporter transmembrane component T family protein [Halolamina sp.]